MDPKQFAQSILNEHESLRHSSDRWDWRDDPEWSGMVALAAMAARWNVSDSEFEERLNRLCKSPTGAAKPAAERMLVLWRQRRATS